MDIQKMKLNALKLEAEISTPDQPASETREEQVALWDAINAYVVHCGGSPDKFIYGNTARQQAVAKIEAIVLHAEPQPQAAAQIEIIRATELTDAQKLFNPQTESASAPTPRTDDHLHAPTGPYYVMEPNIHGTWVLANFCRQLERELSVKTAELREAINDWKGLRDAVFGQENHPCENRANAEAEANLHREKRNQAVEESRRMREALEEIAHLEVETITRPSSRFYTAIRLAKEALSAPAPAPVREGVPPQRLITDEKVAPLDWLTSILERAKIGGTKEARERIASRFLKSLETPVREGDGVELSPMPAVLPRRPYEDHKPDGYLESDRDWFENNSAAVIWFLENAEIIRRHLSESPSVRFEDLHIGQLEREVGKLSGENIELRKIVGRLLDEHSCIADAADEDKDGDDHVIEHEARRILRGDPPKESPSVASGGWRAIEDWLRKHGNGICIAHWNCSFDVELLSGGMDGGKRTILGSGNTIEEAMKYAEARIAELSTDQPREGRAG